jgi:3,4-dihydroxy 2-butanone 4-phosphate synthase/GTP cyclohydrolase II
VSIGLEKIAYSQGGGFLSSTAEIVEDMRNGRMVILVDAENRENEGDLIVPAQMATPDAINFMAKHGRGLICLSLMQSRAEALGLEFMVRTSAARERTAFTQSIEAREGVSTGISAHDRARTIATAIDATKGAADIVSPGHVFPLVAREGGVLIRAGHTEASVDLARLAGLYPAAVICEIMNEDGTMSRLDDLIPFAQHHGLKIGTIEDLIAYRLKHDRLVRQVAETKVESAFGGVFDLHVFTTTVVPGDLLGIGGTGGAVPCSMRAIEQEGRGVIVLIRDLGPKSVSDWIGRRLRPAPDEQGARGRRQVEIGVGSQILRALGVSDMVLLTNAPDDVYVGLEAYGLRIVGTRAIE